MNFVLPRDMSFPNRTKCTPFAPPQARASRWRDFPPHPPFQHLINRKLSSIKMADSTMMLFVKTLIRYLMMLLIFTAFAEAARTNPLCCFCWFNCCQTGSDMDALPIPQPQATSPAVYP